MTQVYPPAPLWKRLCSTIYDILILAAVSLFYMALVTAAAALVHGGKTANFEPTVSGPLLTLGWLLTLLAFYCFFWLKVGQTIAMKAWRLKLVARSGQALTLGKCVLRATLGLIGFLAAGLSYIWILFDRDKLALHDRLSGTAIIVIDRND